MMVLRSVCRLWEWVCCPRKNRGLLAISAIVGVVGAIVVLSNSLGTDSETNGARTDCWSVSAWERLNQSPQNIQSVLQEKLEKLAKEPLEDKGLEFFEGAGVVLWAFTSCERR